MYFIFGNYGDNTIAVMQWAYEAQLLNVHVVNIDTGWGAETWHERVKKAKKLAAQYGFKATTLQPSHTFPELIRDRRSFPTAKYQWCPTFLKALPLLAWLDEVDDRCVGTIILGSRREDSRARKNLQEFIEESEHYGGRKVWYPLFNSSDKARNELVVRTGFEVLNHRSYECYPCIHSPLSELRTLPQATINNIEALETEISATMFHAVAANQKISQLINAKDKSALGAEFIDMGCGSHYSCGE